MTVVELIVVYLITWWLIFFATLPWGVRHDEPVEEGHDPGAPDRPLLWRKAAITTLIATVLVGAVYIAAEHGLLDMREILR